MRPAANRSGRVDEYWAEGLDDLMQSLRTTPAGLTSVEAAARLETHGPNRVFDRDPTTRLRTLVRQLRNPLLGVLVLAALGSAATGEWTDAAIVVVIVAVSVGIGFVREHGAHTAAAALQSRIGARVRVTRDGELRETPSEEIVPGDVVALSAGSLIPADGRIVESTDLFVSESALTGESFPVEKCAGLAAAAAPVRDRANSLFMGTNVRSGSARYVVAATGTATEYGRIAPRLARRRPEGEFDRGIRHFGYLLTSAMIALVFAVLLVHLMRGRSPVETLLFAIALAVGLSPELLPAILSVSLARGATMMAKHGVLVRRLSAIENLGSMDVLCLDKTGTITEDVVGVAGSYDCAAAPASRPLELAALNAALETGLRNPLDDAMLAAAAAIDRSQVMKLGEVPFDFVRKRVSVLFRREGTAYLITKGAVRQVLDLCTRLDDGTAIDAVQRERLMAQSDAWSREGLRALAVASRSFPRDPVCGRDLEGDMSLVGFVTFLDVPKADARDAIARLATLGVQVKIITGDSRAVTQHVAQLVGMRSDRALAGADMLHLSDDALCELADRTDLFAEVDPNQKERIILALRKRGHVVGFLGDGVNDAPAMHASDTSLSVEHAVDVAREAADFVLLEPSLGVVERGIIEGRTTFANTLKYILTTTSANLGNMVSMATASLFLPFLPLTAGQILLNNLLSDVPAAGIAADAVDRDLVERPERWDIGFIARYMLVFGAVSAVFDLLTFGLLLWGFRAGIDLFRSGWFVESLLTELVIALVVRTRRPFFTSRPGPLLLWSTVVLIGLTVALPYLPFAHIFGLVALPVHLTLTIVLITALYMAAAEVTKRLFFGRAVYGWKLPAPAIVGPRHAG